MSEVKQRDDYEWTTQYPQVHYMQTLDLINNQGLMFQLPEHPKVENGKIDETYKIHANHRLIYEFVINNNISGVFEIGCGYGNHLVSIFRLKPDLKIAGCDISQKQIEFAKMRYPEVENFDIEVCDFLDFKTDKKYDIYISQACLMHMSSSRAMMCIEKMCTLSNKYVISCDGGLRIPDFESWIQKFGKVNLMWDFAKENWSDYFVSPFIIEVNHE